MDYGKFIEAKKITTKSTGFNPSWLNGMLFDFQHDITKWTCKKGKSAIWADCGLGKTPMQLEWARQVNEHTSGNVLILAPLAVKYHVHYRTITNYCRGVRENKRREEV